MTKCLLFIGKLFVLKFCFILIVLGRDTSKPGSMSGPRRVGSWFNRKIELNQKMLILKRFVTKIMFYVMMTTEMFINDFSKIKLCCLWRFDDKMSVIYWEMICAKILFYIYCFRVRHLYTWQHWRATKMWQRCYWKQGHHYPQLTKR
jgi:hypothetical protein